MAPKTKGKVCGYARVSSKAGDIQAQQRLITKATGLSKANIKCDVAISGNVPVGHRKIWQQFAKDNVTKVYVKNAKRFARSVLAQEAGLEFARRHGIDVVALDFPTLLTSHSNKGKLVRQIVAAVDEFEKSEFVEIMSKARGKARRENKAAAGTTTLGNKAGKCEGRKSLLQVHGQRIVNALKVVLKKPFKKRISKTGNRIVSWKELAGKLKAKNFQTRRMVSPNGTVRKAGKALSASSLARLLDDVSKRKL